MFTSCGLVPRGIVYTENEPMSSERNPLSLEAEGTEPAAGFRPGPD